MKLYEVLNPNISKVRLVKLDNIHSQEVADCFERNFNLKATHLYNQIKKKRYKAFGYGLRNEQDKLVGFYILQHDKWPHGIASIEFDQKGNGVEGVCLALDKEYRGAGYGKWLINLPQRLGYDFIWGRHMPSLNNLDHWKKRRSFSKTFKDWNDKPMMHITAHRFK